MSDKKVEVGVALRLEQTDAAASEIDKLRKRVLELEGQVEKTDTSFMEMAKQAAAMAFAVNLLPAIHQTIDFAKSLAMASAEGDAADTAVAGLITTVQGIPWGQAKEQAQGFGDDLDELSAKAGVAGDDLAGAFQAMLELRGATERGTADAQRQVEQISVVAGVLGKSAEGLSREFGFMEEGVLKTKGQLFQLLQTTGIFGDNTKKAAQHWASLTEESRIKALDFGLRKVSESMAKAEPSSKQLLTSIESLYDTAKERLGDSLMHELVPVLTSVKDRMSAAVPAIERVAHQIGPAVGHWVGRAVDKVESGLKYLETHSQEISDAITSAYDHAKGVVDFILANKDAIALAFGAKTAIPLVGGAVKGAQAAYAGASGIAGLAGFGGTAGTLAVMGAFAAAVAVFAGAAYFFGKHVQESKEHVEAQTSTLEAITKVAQSGDIARVEKLSATFRQMAMATDGELNPALRTALEHIKGIADTSQRMKQADAGAIEAEIALATSKLKDLPAVTAAQLGAGQSQKAAEEYAANVVANQAALLIDAYGEATRTGNASLAVMAAQTIAGSKALQEAFLKSSANVQGGLEQFADVLLSGGAQFAGFASAIRGKAAKAVPTAPVVHMSGGQTFKITQDFRDQDPDRVALVFQRDMVKLAENRIQARTTIPFGG